MYPLASHQRIRPVASWGFIKRISNASVIQTAIPTTLPPPLNPALVVAKPAIWISRFPGGAIDALAIPHLFGHRRFACKEKNRRNAKNYEFHWCAPLMILFYNVIICGFVPPQRTDRGPVVLTAINRPPVKLGVLAINRKLCMACLLAGMFLDCEECPAGAVWFDLTSLAP
jgi:hypothetical protein